MRRHVVAFLLALVGCSNPDPMVGVVTEDNADALLLNGPAAHGSVGDYYLRNDRIIAIIEKPGRVFGVGPYGGNLIDLGDTTNRTDALGETIPLLNFGLTVNFTEVRVVSDGSGGSPAIIEATGSDVLYDFLNLQAFAPSLLTYDPSGSSLITFDPMEDLPLSVRARYSLAEGADHVEVRYFLHNQSDEELSLHAGYILDMRGDVEPFSIGRGFTDPGVDLDNFAMLLRERIDTPFFAYLGEGYSVGVKSRDFLDGLEVPRMAVAIVGIAIVLLGSENLLDVLDGGDSIIPARGMLGYGFDLVVGDDIADVQHFAEGTPEWGTINGALTENPTGTPIAGARIAAIDPNTGDVLNAFVSDQNGEFGGPVAPGTYQLVADVLTRPLDPGVEVTVNAGGALGVALQLEAPGEVRVQVQLMDDPFGAAIGPGPCRLALVGDAPRRNGGICGAGVMCDVNEPFRHGKHWELDRPIPFVQYLLACDSVTGPDAPLGALPGRYLAVVSRGPEYDTLREIVDVTAGGSVTISGVIRRVVDSDGLAASDFHVHQLHSPDSVVPYEERVKGYAANGMDFFAATDHDAVTDLRPVIRALGLDDELQMVPGVESSTPDLGHFNGYPIEPIPGLQAGAPIDWGGAGQRPSIRQVFDRMRERGAKVVSINHPRESTAYFDAIGLTYDLGMGLVQADPAVHAPASILLIDPSEPMFATNFDAIEIYNSTRNHQQVMRDWFNFLSMGLRVTGLAVSDSHDQYRQNPGEPRTYVKVRSDRPDRWDPDDLLDNLKGGFAFGSSGPVVRLTLEAGAAAAGIGELLTPAAGDVSLRLHVETPTWYEVSTAEIFITRTYAFIEETELVGDYTLPLSPQMVARPNGGEAYVYDLVHGLTAADLGTLDGWVVVRVRGPGSTQYPVSMKSGSAILNTSSPTVAGFASFVGKAPYAFTNPVFLDRDLSGQYDPPFPMR